MKTMGNTVLRTALVAVFALAVEGCSAFEPREANPPETQVGLTPFVPANDAAGVFPNLKSGVENLSTGANYERSLAEDFTFEALLEDRLDLGETIFQGWDKARETSVLESMLAGADSAEAHFSQTPLQDETNFVQFRVTYRLRLVSNADGSVATYRGVAEFDIRRNSGIWQLEKWKEIESIDPFTTWGFLKGSIWGQIGG